MAYKTRFITFAHHYVPPLEVWSGDKTNYFLVPEGGYEIVMTHPTHKLQEPKPTTHAVPLPVANLEGAF